MILENTRKIYMAITRPGQRVVVTYASKLPKEFAQIFGGTRLIVRRHAEKRPQKG